MSTLVTHALELLLSRRETLFQTGKQTMVFLILIGTYMGLWFFSGILEKLGILNLLRIILLVVSVFVAGVVGCMIVYDALCRRARRSSIWQ